MHDEVKVKILNKGFLVQMGSIDNYFIYKNIEHIGRCHNKLHLVHANGKTSDIAFGTTLEDLKTLEAVFERLINKLDA